MHWAAKYQGRPDLETRDAVSYVAVHTENFSVLIEVCNHNDEMTASFGVLPCLACHLRPANHRLLP